MLRIMFPSPETAVGRFDAEDAMLREQPGAGAPDRTKQRVQYVASPMAVGKQLAVCFFMERHVQVLKKADRVVGGERAQHLFDQRSAATPEIGFGHLAIRDVAPRPAADQDLRARASCAVEDKNGSRRVGAPGKDRRCQASGPRADDNDVSASRRRR